MEKVIQSLNCGQTDTPSVRGEALGESLGKSLSLDNLFETVDSSIKYVQ